MKEEKRRYVGIDLGKREYTMAIIGRNGKMSIHKGTTTEKGRAALYRLLEKDDKVALEAGKLAFGIAREIMQRVGSEVRVLNSAKLPVIWGEPTKTDKEDAMKLAHLVEERRDEKLPIVPLPSEQEMERREVISGYQREVRGRTRVVNTPHSLFWKQGQTQIVRKDLATVAKAREAVKILTGLIREDAEWQLRHLELHEKRLGELRDRIKAEAKGGREHETPSGHRRGRGHSGLRLRRPCGGRQPFRQRGAGEQLPGLRPQTGLFREHTAARPNKQTRERVPAWAACAGGIGDGAFEQRRGFKGQVYIPDAGAWK